MAEIVEATGAQARPGRIGRAHGDRPLISSSSARTAAPRSPRTSRSARTAARGCASARRRSSGRDDLRAQGPPQPPHEARPPASAASRAPGPGLRALRPWATIARRLSVSMWIARSGSPTSRHPGLAEHRAAAAVLRRLRLFRRLVSGGHAGGRRPLRLAARAPPRPAGGGRAVRSRRDRRPRRRRRARRAGRGRQRRGARAAVRVGDARRAGRQPRRGVRRRPARHRGHQHRRVPDAGVRSQASWVAGGVGVLVGAIGERCSLACPTREAGPGAGALRGPRRLRRRRPQRRQADLHARRGDDDCEPLPGGDPEARPAHQLSADRPRSSPRRFRC